MLCSRPTCKPTSIGLTPITAAMRASGVWCAALRSSCSGEKPSWVTLAPLLSTPTAPRLPPPKRAARRGHHQAPDGRVAQERVGEQGGLVVAGALADEPADGGQPEAVVVLVHAQPEVHHVFDGELLDVPEAVIPDVVADKHAPGAVLGRRIGPHVAAGVGPQL